MRLRWTAPAGHDLYSITRYIRRDNPTAAREVAKTIYDGCDSLINSPHRGRKRKQTGMRESVVFSLAVHTGLTARPKT